MNWSSVLVKATKAILAADEGDAHRPLVVCFAFLDTVEVLKERGFNVELLFSTKNKGIVADTDKLNVEGAIGRCGRLRDRQQ